MAVFTAAKFPKPTVTHLWATKALFYALSQSGWVLSLSKSTFMTTKFVFLGITWDTQTQSTMAQNNRVQNIVNHRDPQSLAELNSRLASLNYYQSYLPALKRLSLPLYALAKEGVFKWTRLEAQAWHNVKFLMGLNIKNKIFDPYAALFILPDTSLVESSVFLQQWNSITLSMEIVACKSTMLSQALRNQAACHRESAGIWQGLQLASRLTRWQQGGLANGSPVSLETGSLNEET